MMVQSKPKLLVIEDDAGLQAQLKWAYEDFEVTVVGDRASGLAALRADEPAVVTLDLGLPPDPDGTTEGFAVLDQIMAIKPDTKVIVASGHGARESARSTNPHHWSRFRRYRSADARRARQARWPRRHGSRQRVAPSDRQRPHKRPVSMLFSTRPDKNRAAASRNPEAPSDPS